MGVDDFHVEAIKIALVVGLCCNAHRRYAYHIMIMDDLPIFEDRMSEDTKMADLFAGYIERNDYIGDTF